MVTTIITAMAAYSNESVAAIILSVLYRMLTIQVVLILSLVGTGAPAPCRWAFPDR